MIGSYYGDKILLATPLLQWYLEKDLEVTDVDMVLEFKPNACFQNFGNFVSNARRQGDQDPDKAILADSAKLLGNSVSSLISFKNCKMDIVCACA